jgi:hypothetical protein
MEHASRSTSRIRSTILRGLASALFLLPSLTGCGAPIDGDGAVRAGADQHRRIRRIARGSSCAGVVPDLACVRPLELSFVSFHADGAPDPNACLPGTSDGDGNLLWGGWGEEPGQFVLRLFAPDAAPRGTFVLLDTTPSALAPQYTGFQIARFNHRTRRDELLTLAPDGRLLSAIPYSGTQFAIGVAIAPQPYGGTLLVSDFIASDFNRWYRMIRRVDDRGAVVVSRASELMAGPPPGLLAAALDVREDALVVDRRGDRAVGRWYVGSVGVPATGEFDLFTGVTASTEIALVPLIGGGVAVRRDGIWAGVIAVDATRLDPAPAWLAAIPDSDLRVVEAGGAWARTRRRPGSGDSDDRRIDLHAPDGTYCGAIEVPAYGGDRGRRMSIGLDGTIIQLTARPAPPPHRGSTRCDYRIWPQLLR